MLSLTTSSTPPIRHPKNTYLNRECVQLRRQLLFASNLNIFVRITLYYSSDPPNHFEIMSTGVGVSSCCLSGKLADGTPAGREETIGGLPTYVAEPADNSKAKSLLFITDIFGWKLPNVRLLADNYAKGIVPPLSACIANTLVFSSLLPQSLRPARRQSLK